MRPKRATLVHAAECAVGATPRGVCDCHLALRPPAKPPVELDLSDLEGLDGLFDSILDAPDDEDLTPVLACDGTDLTQAPTVPARFIGFTDDPEDERLAVYEWPG